MVLTADVKYFCLCLRLFSPLSCFAGETAKKLSFPFKDKDSFASVSGLLLSPSLLRVKDSLPALFLPTFRGCYHTQDYWCICFNESHMNSKELSRAALD